MQVEFSVNADAQKFLSKSGKTLADAIGAFTADMDTLINKTMEDTLVNARQYQAARWVPRLFLSAERASQACPPGWSTTPSGWTWRS